MQEVVPITVEFFGIPRQRAGRGEVSVRARTVGEALAAVVRQCPSLSGLRSADGTLAKQFLLSLNGERFITDLEEVLTGGEHLLLLSADAGG